MAKMRREQLHNEKKYDGYSSFFSSINYCIENFSAEKLLYYLCDQKNGFWITTNGIRKRTGLTINRISEARKYLFKMGFLESPEDGVLRINYDRLNTFLFVKTDANMNYSLKKIVPNISNDT